MKINRLHLENIRSYEDQEVEFPEGTILIHGENGAGKTSLLMGMFGGLFLSNITNVGSNSFNLSDLVRRGEDKGCVEIDFEVAGDEYAVEWTMPGEDSGSASSATLTSPALPEPVSGITTVQEEVTALLGMDEDDFSSSAYVKQGEIDRLIEANDRGAMIDSLLGLDQIEEYIERAKLGRRGARRVYEGCQERRRGQEDNLDDYEHNEEGYRDQIQQLDNAISEKKDEAQECQDHIDEELTPLLNDAKSTLESHEKLSQQLADKNEQIENAESKRKKARKSKQDKEDEITEHNEKISNLRDETSALDEEVEYDLSTAESTTEALSTVQDDRLDAQQKKNNHENDYKNAQDNLVDAQSELEDVADDLADAREKKDEITEAIFDAEGTVEDHEEQLRKDLSDLTETLVDFEVAANFGVDPSEGADDTVKPSDVDLSVATDALAPLVRNRIPDRQDEVNERIKEIAGEIGQLETKANSLNDEIETLRELEAAGECPKCGQDVDESHVDEEIADVESEQERINKQIEEKEAEEKEFQRRSGQLSGIRNSVNDAIDFQTDTLGDARERVENLRDDREDIQEEISDLEADKDELERNIGDLETKVDDAEEDFESARDNMEAVAATSESVKEADETYDKIADHQNAIEQAQQSITHATEQIDDLDEQLETLRDERKSIQEDRSDLDTDGIKDQIAKIEDEIEDWEQQRDEAQERVEELQGKRGSVKTTLEKLQSLKDNIDELERRERWADSVREDLEATLSIYNEVQSDLRETYLGYLNEYANDIFKEIYKNSSYQQVIIREEHDETYDTYDYDIQLLRDDGTTEDPANASGGERAVVNLALRAGVYRLIAQIRGTERSTLPPFILDEPTTFLDEGHVGQLEEMLDTIREWDVAQVFVVSHDESLIHGADHECLVTKDDDSTSQIEMRLAGEDYGDGQDRAETTTEAPP